MEHTFLICSAAYVESELEAEFGHIPPAFLPLGNRRLFVHQRAAIGDLGARLLLSLPDDFVPDAMDIELLNELNIEVVPVPNGVSLGDSIVYAINVTAIAGSRLSIMHGDTLIRDVDFQLLDAVSVSSSVPPGYRWGYVETRDGQMDVSAATDGSEKAVALSGYFAFQDAARLVQGITRCGGKFLAGIADYSRSHPLATIVAGQWLDFGHVNTYHQSRRAVTTQRVFNSLISRRRFISKSGANPRKVEAEARWFDELPACMRVYTPAYLGMSKDDDNAVTYSVEYLPLPILSDLCVFGRLSAPAWEKIFASCGEFLDACRTFAGPPSAISRSLYEEKTLQRLERFAKETGIRLNEPCRFNGNWLPPLEQMASLTAARIPQTPDRSVTLVHGDFCFSNIFYDFRGDGVRVIDPRGLDAADNFSIYGDIRYDIGKLYHSAIGRYDFIMAGYYECTRLGNLDFDLTLPENAATRALTDAFAVQNFGGYRPADAAAHAISILLFLSMLPLHNDDRNRQFAFLANAMRLFLMNDLICPA